MREEGNVWDHQCVCVCVIGVHFARDQRRAPLSQPVKKTKKEEGEESWDEKGGKGRQERKRLRHKTFACARERQSKVVDKDTHKRAK